MLKYPCLILDHDDTVVSSEATVNYPCLCRFLEKYRPGESITLAEYVDGCSTMSFGQWCQARFSLSAEEMHLEYLFWKDYVKSHIPEAYPGIKKLLHDYRNAGGKICVVSMSSKENILRDYRHHFDLIPDVIYGCDLPQEKQKPSTWALEQICIQYGFAPKQLLVIDDMRFAVAMARNANSPIAFAGWGRKDFPAICEEMTKLCDYSFYSVAEFTEFLFKELDNHAIIS